MCLDSGCAHPVASAEKLNQCIMENSHKTLHLYIPMNKSRHWSPSLSYCGGPPSPFKASLELQQGPTSHCKEEEKDSIKTEKQDQTDTFGLRDRRESLEPLGDLSRIGRLTDLLPLCLERQAFIRMGNQQGMKIKSHYHGHAENLDALPKSPRFQIPRKRRRRTERPVYSTDSLQRFKITPRILPLRARGVTRLQITSSPTLGEWDSEEDGQIFCTPACRRKRVLKAHELQPSLRMKSPGGLTAEKKDPSFPRNGSSAKKESLLPDSDTDQSEYDELYSVFTSSYSKEPAKKTEDDVWETPKFPIIQPESDKVQEKWAKVAEMKSPWICDEMGRRDAAQQVMGKIEELESIIRQVSLNSSDWTREEEAKCPGQVDEGKQRCRAELSSQNKLSKEDKPLLIEEFQTLSEALSRSLRQVLKVEGAREEKKVLTDDEKISSESNPLPYSDHFTSRVPNNTSSQSHSAHVETSSVPSPSLSDVSERTSSSFEVMSSILSPLFTSSQHSLSVSPTHQQEEVISDDRNGTISLVGDKLSAHWTGGCQAVTADPSERENDNRKTFCQGNLTQSGQDEMHILQSFSERDDLLSSGNNTNYALHQEV